MNRLVQYLVVQMQNGRVTFVNGNWIGTEELSADRTAESLASCPWVWDYLQILGSEGWDMIGSTPTGINLSGVSIPEQPPSMETGDIVMSMNYRFVAGADQQTQLMFFRRYGRTLEE